jgi:hypothetical protein
MSAAYRWSIAASAMAAAASLVGPPAMAATGDPVAFAKTLYAQPDPWMSIASTPDSRSQYLALLLTPLVGSNRTGVFKSALAYDPLAYDPVADIGEKPLLSDETFTLVGSDDDGTSVKVDFKNHGRADKVTLKLVSSDDHDRWLLADIDFPDGQTLMKALQPGCVSDG